VATAPLAGGGALPPGATPVAVITPDGAAAARVAAAAAGPGGVAAAVAAAAAAAAAAAGGGGSGGGGWATLESTPLPPAADASVGALRRVGALFAALAGGAAVPGGGEGGWGGAPGEALDAAGGWVRGTAGGRLAFEVCLDGDGRGAYRCWGDDGRVRGEVRWADPGGRVEFLRWDGVEVTGARVP